MRTLFRNLGRLVEMIFHPSRFCPHWKRMDETWNCHKCW